MTPLISVLIIPGAVSTAVNMVAAMVKRISNGIEKRLLKKGQLIKTQVKTVFYVTDCFCIKSYGVKKWVGKI